MQDKVKLYVEMGNCIDKTCTKPLCAAADRTNCYFNDPNVDWKGALRADGVSGATVFDSIKHRKIRLYVEMGDDIDNTGHGTHTMGSLLGSPYDISNVKALDYRSPSQQDISSLHM